MSTSSPSGRKGDLRIAWKSAFSAERQGEGHGEWFPPEERSMLMEHVDAMNPKYGAGTHRLEEYVTAAAAL